MAVEEGILSQTEIDEAREDLPDNVFKELYLAMGGNSPDTLYESVPIADMFTNAFVKSANDKDDEVKFYISADIALHGSDKFVIGVWRGWELVEIIVVDKCDGPTVEKLLKDMAEKYEVPRSRIVYDADGLGAFLKGYLKGAIAFHNGGSPIPVQGKTKVDYTNIKAQCAYKLAKRLDKIYIESDSYEMEITEELSVIKKRMTGEHKYGISKKEEIKETLGHSPDFADMFIMRAYFDIRRFDGNYDDYFG